MKPMLIPTRPPRQHQKDALDHARDKSSFFYLLSMGCGKSKIAIDECLQLYIDGVIDRVLIVAGKGSYSDWRWKHLPENVPDHMSVTAHLWDGGSTKREEDAIRALMFQAPGYGHATLRCLIMNVEAFGASKTALTVAMNFTKGGRTLVICDESTKIRNTDAKRTQAMIALGREARVRRAMTGLATPKNPLDLWGQMKFLGLIEVLGRNWYSFRARYCIMKTEEHQKRGAPPGTMEKSLKIVAFRNLDELTERMRPHSFRALKENCLDLPPKIYERVLVDLTDEQHRAYQNMLRMAMHELEDGVFASALNAIGRIEKLHQITCGHLKDEDGRVHELPNGRLQALDDVIQEAEGKVIVWCTYQHDVLAVTQHLQAAFPERRVVQYYGPTSAPQRAANVRDFEEGDATYFVGTQATGGFGITLVSCSLVIYYSNSFDLEFRLQSEDRCHRDGQTKSVTYVDLVAPRTVDEKILKALIEKKSVADVIMDGGIQSWLTMS